MKIKLYGPSMRDLIAACETEEELRQYMKEMAEAREAGVLRRLSHSETVKLSRAYNLRLKAIRDARPLS